MFKAQMKSEDTVVICDELAEDTTNNVVGDINILNENGNITETILRATFDENYTRLGELDIDFNVIGE